MYGQLRNLLTGYCVDTIINSNIAYVLILVVLSEKISGCKMAGNIIRYQDCSTVHCTTQQPLLESSHWHLLDTELSRTQREAVHKLDGTPYAVELLTFIDAHDSIGRQRSSPEHILQEGLGLLHHHPKERKSNAQPLLGQEHTLIGNELLLQRGGVGEDGWGGEG